MGDIRSMRKDEREMRKGRQRCEGKGAMEGKGSVKKGKAGKQLNVSNVAGGKAKSSSRGKKCPRQERKG